jgi:hypothetical protein
MSHGFWKIDWELAVSSGNGSGKAKELLSNPIRLGIPVNKAGINNSKKNDLLSNFLDIINQDNMQINRCQCKDFFSYMFTISMRYMIFDKFNKHKIEIFSESAPILERSPI